MEYDTRKVIKVVNILLPAQLVTFIAASIVLYSVRDYQPVFKPSQQQLLEGLIFMYVALGICNLLFLLVGYSEAKSKRAFLSPYRLILAGLVVVSFIGAHLVVHIVAAHALVDPGTWPFIP